MDFKYSDSSEYSEDNAKFIYEFYFYIGLLCTLVTGILYILYFVKKLRRMHPNRIIINILFLQFLNSLKYSVTFIVYKSEGNDLNYSPFHSRDFGFAHFGCKIEGLVSYVIFICIVLWNFLWTYDTYLTVKDPMRYTENFIFYYKVFVYFAGLIFSLVVFFPNMDLFSDNTLFI